MDFGRHQKGTDCASIMQVPHFKKRKYTAALLICSSLFAGCVNYPHQVELPIYTQSMLKEDYYTVDIPSFDGETIRATIFQPELEPYETAPVIIHAHGFGLFRMSSPVSLYGSLLFSGQAAKNAWKNGYWVVSIDHRGHGGSGGQINMMDPETEVKDLKWVIDWIENNLPRLTYKDKKPMVGMVGESYGGGLQLLGASLDDRIKAIVPITTWYDFSGVLTPNNVVKSGWLTSLVAFGNLMNPTTMNRSMTSSYFSSITSEVPATFAPMMMSRSLSNSCYCRADAWPHADAFFIQGFKDVLFPLNEAVSNMSCLEAAGRDVRLLGTQYGHLLPMTQFSWGVPGYDIENEVHCDDKVFKPIDLVLAWFDEKLKGKEKRADIIPKVCLTYNFEEGGTYTEVPVGGERFTFSKAEVKNGLQGLMEIPFSAFDLAADTLTFSTNTYNEIKPEETNNQSGVLRPVFVPLKRVQQKSVVAGIPVADFTLTGQHKDVVFAGIAVLRNGQTQPELMSDQVYPFRGGNSLRVNLPGVSAVLKPGDVLGLMFAGYNNQYRLSGKLSTHASVSGEVLIPLEAKE
ncbi:MAG: alpha/beta fold hydrolase [Pseudomonadota bacterium]|nr:alpha/beta fold hydrolase [Pseudomonadota bacterium]